VSLPALASLAQGRAAKGDAPRAAAAVSCVVSCVVLCVVA